MLSSSARVVTVIIVTGWISTAPKSIAAPAGRGSPRWSVAGVLAVATPASIAGGPSGSRVCVGPPLLPRVPRLAVARLPAVPTSGRPNGKVVVTVVLSPIRLLPSAETEPLSR